MTKLFEPEANLEGAMDSSGPSWTVTVRVSLPVSTEYLIHPTAYSRIARLLPAGGPVIGQSHGHLLIVFGVKAPDEIEAQRDVTPLLSKITTMLGLSASAVRSVAIVSDDEETPDPDLYELVGVREAADILGVSKQRVSQLARTEGFPRPKAMLYATPVWLAADVRRFAGHRHQGSGPLLTTLNHALTLRRVVE